LRNSCISERKPSNIVYGGFVESHVDDLYSPLLSFVPIASYADASLKNRPVHCQLGITTISYTIYEINK
jgi:hypothetical protein